VFVKYNINMSFFEKLKRDIGITEGEKETIKEKEEVPKVKAEKKKRKLTPPPVKASVDKKATESKKEEPEKIPVSLPKKESAGWLKAEGQLAVDVYQTNSEFCVQAPIAGVELEDLEVSVENEMLLIKGERKEPVGDKEKNYFYQECYWGPFSRQVILPDDVDVSRIRASLNGGILSVKIPRVKRVKRKRVTIQTTE